MQKFFKAYIEITNICGLHCSFCPPKKTPNTTMSLELFEKILQELKPYTKEIAYHVVGDPLKVSNLKEYLDLTQKHKFIGHITTTGYFLPKIDSQVLLHPCIKQINFSLNSYNKNNLPISFEEYINPILKFCKEKIESSNNSFINLRLWNFDDTKSEKHYNKKVFNHFSEFFNINLAINYNKSIRLTKKVLLHFDSYFEWPSLDSSKRTHNFCHGLSSQIAFLANGDVVPCCLDKDGIINLGNIKNISLKEILQSEKAIAIKEAFSKNIAIHPLCQTCGYKDRFSK